MSATERSHVPPRKSFAQVAAAANKTRTKKEKPQTTSDNVDKVKNAAPTTPNGHPAGLMTTNSLSHPNNMQKIEQDAVSGKVDVQKNTTNVVNELSQSMISASLDEQPAPSMMTSESNMKKDNSDTKSITSRTTLTFDEKESLRPDDSASMQAAPEDDAFSPADSIVTNSLQYSESDTHAFRAQLNQISVHAGGRVIMPRAQRPDSISMGDPRVGGIVFPAPQMPNVFVPLNQPVMEVPRPSQPTVWTVPPDDKLLEALASPKDRLFVLKVEQDIIDFVKDPKEEILQLPGTNSFYRMLSHKLADYYMLGHSVDDTMSSVRIFRTPHSILPPPLIGSTPGTSNSTPPPSAHARKIMRRNGASRSIITQESAEPGFDSLTSSKATSDVGSSLEDGKDSKTDKNSLTREERENRYKEARARIFKDFEGKENGEASSNQTDKGLSRSSSTSGVKKVKKQRKPKDDGFEARSAFDSYGRRLSENNFGPNSADPNSFGPYAFDTEGRFIPNLAPMPNGPPLQMAYGMSNAANMTWTNQNMGMANFQPQYPTDSPTFGQIPYSPTNNQYSGQYGSPLASDRTPRVSAQPLSNYGQGYMAGPPMATWQQDSYPQYGQQAYPYQEFSEWNNYYGGPNMQAAQIGPMSSYGSPTQGFNQVFYPGEFDGQQNFNPRSQSFIPGMQGSNGQFMGPPAGFMSGPPGHSIQPQMPDGSRGGFPQAQTPQNGRGRAPNGMSNGPNGNRQQGSQQGNQQSSIAKWPAPANLPAKPPPPATNVQIPTDPDNTQPLPPKPIPIR